MIGAFCFVFVGTKNLYVGLLMQKRFYVTTAIDYANGDIIAFGRPFIGNPDLVERLKADAPLHEAPLKAYYGGGARGYTDFPTMEEA